MTKNTGGSADPGNKTVAHGVGYEVDPIHRDEMSLATTIGEVMSNANRKAKGTTMVDKKLAKTEARLAQVTQQLQATNLSLMNMRQMYEGAVTEKQGFRAQLVRSNQIITALIIQARGKKLVIKEATFEKLAGYAGFDPVADGGDLILTPLTVEDIEDMQTEIEDEQGE